MGEDQVSLINLNFSWAYGEQVIGWEETPRTAPASRGKPLAYSYSRDACTCGYWTADHLRLTYAGRGSKWNSRLS